MSSHAKQAWSIIVADDEHHIRTVVASKLRASGFRVREAADGEEALQLALEEVPDAVVTDLQMPMMSGMELAMALKLDPSTAHVPAVLLTARGYVVTDEQLARTNIRHLMSKPFSAREVLARVQDILGIATATSEAA
ncbi:MAG: two-component system response regulator [Phycisphaerales bacterium]